MVDVAIVGAPGYAGVELTRLVAGHPELRIAMLTSGADAGKRVGDVYPALAPHVDGVYVAPDVDRIAGEAQLAFLAVPHTAAMAIAPALLEAGLTVIDASADFRLRDAAVYEQWYGVGHTCPELLAEAVYGLPELDRAGLAGARLVACAGCYPTATLLAAAPALESGIAAPGRVVVDAKSGISGAGRTPSEATHFPTVGESVAPYKVASHRHTPEIAQGLARAAGTGVGVVFSPHLVPLSRGLLATVYLELAVGHSAEEVVAAYRERYAGEPFITVHEPGRMPSTAEVRGSNRAHIGIATDPATSTLVVACAIDNLVKGTSGQAVQCANLVFGFGETTGLDHPVPVV